MQALGNVISRTLNCERHVDITQEQTSNYRHLQNNNTAHRVYLMEINVSKELKKSYKAIMCVCSGVCVQMDLRATNVR